MTDDRSSARASRHVGGLSRFVVALWVLAVYLAVLYVAVRWGGHSPPRNLLPSAD